MRCPFCGGLNSDKASFCAQCGRDLPQTQANTRQQPPQRPQQQPPYLPQRQPVQPAQYPPQPPMQRPPQTQGAAARPTAPQYQPPRSPQPPPVARPAQMPPQPRVPQVLPPQVVESPEHFPPHTLAHLKALQGEAVPYTLVEEVIADGRKKIVRIAYQNCYPWQQVATLLQAFNEQTLGTFTTIVIQGVSEQDRTAYAFTNGQLQYDRGVRLGSQTLNRYQIETGNGFASDSVRIVLAE